MSELHKLAAEAKDWSPLKGGLPLAALVGGMLLYKGLKGSVERGVEDQQVQLQARRALAANRNAGANASLRGGAPLDPVGGALYQAERFDSGVPGDYAMFDKDAAAFGVEAGRLLAKHAGIGGVIAKGLGAVNKTPDLLLRGAQAVAKPVVSRLPGPSLGTKALIGGAALGTGLLAMKAGKKVMEYGMGPAQERTWGGPAAHLPHYVNQYGVPSMG